MKRTRDERFVRETAPVPERNRGIQMYEPLLFERGSPGRRGSSLPPLDPDEEAVETLPEDLCRDDLEDFPELSEMEVLRHFLRLSQWNFGAATNFYPLGSCTMKYNPVVNEQVARLPGFGGLHPNAPDSMVQGALELMAELESWLVDVSGMEAVSLQPAAGAHGELAGMKMIRAYHRRRGDQRRKVLIPKSAHGTNPASSALCGYEVLPIEANREGIIGADDVARAVDDDVAAIMITNPNTLGLFERDIERIAEILHERDALVYMDGANMNALLGVAKPGHMGVDVLQFNLHKTFSTPHGGGGPGSGPVAVGERLRDHLPVPRIVRRGDRFELSDDFPESIGRIHGFFGNFGMMVRAYAYIMALGNDGLRQATRMAILNANYLRRRLEEAFHLPMQQPCLHECVFSDRTLEPRGIKTLDLAKRLLDYGCYAPTIYFPLVVSGAIMIEPTESETRETLDEFVHAMKAILEEADQDPDAVRQAPRVARLTRLDEVRAARHPVFRWESSRED